MNFEIKWPKELVRIIELLDGRARLVGGCVRDYILYKELVEDIDIATEFLPQEVISRLEQEFQVIPTGLKHGTITVVKGGHKYEVTTLRSDEETDGRHAKVAYNKTWEEDSKRRDFTMNALYMDLNGTIYDYNNGIADLDKKLVKFISDARKRIHEDYLRIMRFFRFAVRFGNYDQESLNACIELCPNLEKISKERVTSEFIKIVDGEYFYQMLNLLKPVFKVIGLHDFFGFDLFSYFMYEKNAENVDKKTIDRMNNIKKLTTLGKVALFWNANSNLLLSNAQKKYVSNLQNMKLISLTDAILCAHKFGDEFVRDSMILNDVYFEIPEVSALPISGLDLMNLNIYGADIKLVLDQLNRYWVSSLGTYAHDELLKKAQEIYHSIKK